MLRRLAISLVAALAVGLSAGVAPAAAIETTTFGIDVAEPTPDRRLHIPLRVDRSSTRTMRVWNKADRAITLNLSVAGAELGDGGAVSLGGDGKAAAWVRVEPSRVDLAVGASAEVAVSARATDGLPADDQVVAVLVTPSVAQGDAVVQRLALTAFLEPAGPPTFVESLGPWPWVAAALLAAVATAAALRHRGRSRDRGRGRRRPLRVPTGSG